MRYYTESLKDNRTAFVFPDADAPLVIGIIGDANGNVLSQVLNPAIRPPTYTEEKIARHGVVRVEGTDYTTVDLDVPLSLREYVATANVDTCSTNMLTFLKWQLPNQIFKAARTPGLN